MEQRVRPQKLRVIDVHTHFPIVNTMGGPPPGPRHPLLEAYARERGERMRAEWGTAPAEPLARTDQEVDAALERWVGEVERYDLDKVVFVSGGGNDRLAGLVAKHPDRFVGLAHHRLEPGAGAELRRAVDELGLRGYKLLGPTTDYPFEAPELRDVWEFLAERQLPALIHFGFLGRGGGVVQHPRMSPLSLFEVARDFPEVPFIVPHFGAGYFQDLLALCWSLPNVYIDTSGSNQWMRWMPYPLTLEDLFRKALETVGPERIVFGSDSSYFPRGFAERYLLDQLRACYTLNVKDEDVALIFGGNAARLLRLDVPAAEGGAA
ncbi:MAG: amidohydrolase [Deinococcales bacterium]|nr:amidohydrolase [Deinococcales bacterium]